MIWQNSQKNTYAGVSFLIRLQEKKENVYVSLDTNTSFLAIVCNIVRLWWNTIDYWNFLQKEDSN